jgi:Gas vesicle synthesis protein GvpL/GvpF
MKLYVYGVIDSVDEINERMSGVGGSAVYSIPYREMGVVVSGMDPATQAAAENHVLEHEAIVERLTVDFTVLPMRFWTVVDGREDLLSMMDSHYSGFKTNLERLRDKLEFGVKVIWPADKVKQNIISRLRSDKPQASGPHGSAGIQFMNEKFRQYKIEKEFQARAERFVNVMDMFLGKFAVEKRLRKLKTEKLLLDAVYLVEKSRAFNFREAFWHLKNAHPGFKFLLSGPWPVYNFIAASRRSGHDKNVEAADLLAQAAQSDALAGVNKL